MSKPKRKDLSIIKILFVLGITTILSVVGISVYLNNVKTNQTSASWKQVVLEGCSATDVPLKYSLELPSDWTITKVNQSFDDGNYIMGTNPPGNFSYKAVSDSGEFSIGCMSNGIKGGGCGLQHTTFTIDGKSVDACVGEYNGKYHMGTDYMDSPKSKATTEFWSDGIDLQTINRIFNTFKFE